MSATIETRFVAVDATDLSAVRTVILSAGHEGWRFAGETVYTPDDPNEDPEEADRKAGDGWYTLVFQRERPQ